MTSTSDNSPTDDAFLGGALHLLQPRHGYRAGTDPVLLAACVPARPGDSVLDLGCGVGTALFCVATRVSDLALTGVELQPDYADLARENAKRNGLTAQITTADIRALPTDITDQRYDHVILNPPYFAPGRGKAPRDTGKTTAFSGDTPLRDWLDVAGKRVAPKGTLTLIQKTDRLQQVLGALPRHLGSVIVKPLTARAGRDADRFLLQAKHSGRAALRLASPLVLHEGDMHVSDQPDHSAQIAGILRKAEKLDLQT